MSFAFTIIINFDFKGYWVHDPLVFFSSSPKKLHMFLLNDAEATAARTTCNNIIAADFVVGASDGGNSKRNKCSVVASIN